MTFSTCAINTELLSTETKEATYEVRGLNDGDEEGKIYSTSSTLYLVRSHHSQISSLGVDDKSTGIVRHLQTSGLNGNL